MVGHNPKTTILKFHVKCLECDFEYNTPEPSSAAHDHHFLTGHAMKGEIIEVQTVVFHENKLIKDFIAAKEAEESQGVD